MTLQKVAIYCRLSTDDDCVSITGEESESIQNQKLLLSDYAKKQGWEIYNIYSDSDWSGLRDDRPAFMEMLSHAQAGDFSIILCKTQSRFTRNMETAERYLHHYFLLWGIRFVTVVDHADTQLAENKKTRQINSLINEWYSEEISDNIRAIFRRKMELGQFMGNYAPYGYQKDNCCRHHLVIDGQTAPVVLSIFTWYVEGLSCKQIALRLTEQNIPTPWQQKILNGVDTGRKNVKHPTIWAESTIRKILKNRVYIGDMVQGKEKKLNFKQSKVIAVPASDWIIVENTHEPIISKELFLQAQQMRQRHTRKTKQIDK